jgi:putative addiction module component (TIGR02574 family)
MSPSTEELLHAALNLDDSESCLVAGALIESLHGPSPPGVEEAWEAVIERRVRELEAGTAETIPWSEVRARLFSGFE